MRSLSLLIGLCALASICTAGCGSSDPPQTTVTYTKDVKPILMAKCAPCHGGQHQGMHDLASNYADAKKPVQSLQFDACWGDVTTMSMPKTVGECALILSRNGQMPNGFGCDKNPQPTPALCVSPAELQVMADWVAAGMPE